MLCKAQGDGIWSQPNLLFKQIQHCTVSAPLTMRVIPSSELNLFFSEQRGEGKDFFIGHIDNIAQQLFIALNKTANVLSFK
ncbi:hypothetical protein ACNFJN_12160 [Xenorhabdus budapestensis]|uniref:hypothetical protein n=1 Tax=Xenorhabdus budapestensis TaxID=290110 RepID=UPI003A8740F6